MSTSCCESVHMAEYFSVNDCRQPRCSANRPNPCDSFENRVGSDEICSRSPTNVKRKQETMKIVPLRNLVIWPYNSLYTLTRFLFYRLIGLFTMSTAFLRAAITLRILFPIHSWLYTRWSAVHLKQCRREFVWNGQRKYGKPSNVEQRFIAYCCPILYFTQCQGFMLNSTSRKPFWSN